MSDIDYDDRQNTTRQKKRSQFKDYVSGQINKRKRKANQERVQAILSRLDQINRSNLKRTPEVDSLKKEFKALTNLSVEDYMGIQSRYSQPNNNRVQFAPRNITRDNLNSPRPSSSRRGLGNEAYDIGSGQPVSRNSNNLGQNASLTTNTPSNRTTTKTSSRTNKNSGVKGKSLARGTPTDNELLKRQALDRLKNSKFGYKQFGGLGAGDDSFEDEPRQTDRSRFKSRLSSPPNQREEELAANERENARVNREANLKNVDKYQDMNALEQLVSRIIGKDIRFEDIPEDDPFITNMPQNYQNLRRGGQVKRMGHGGAITPEQKKRISRIVQENKARKSKSTKSTPTATSSKKRAAPFSDMKKARMNGNKKRTNR